MKKKAEITEKRNFFEKFCVAQEGKARISLIIAVAVVVATIGSVCTASIALNSDTSVPSDVMELNAAENYLAQAAFEASTSETSQIVDVSEFVEDTSASSQEPGVTKRGALTGEHVVDYGDLKSLSDEDLVKAIVSGNAGVIKRSDIKTDQSQNENAGHKASVGNAPVATNTPTPVPTNVSTPTMAPITTVNFELGIDISEWQGSINWSKVKAAGIQFAFIRIGGRGTSKGAIYEDKMFSTNIKNAKANGIKVGVYFFSQAITPYEALEEASFTLSKLGGMSLDLPVVMDWESESGFRSYDLKGQDYTNVIISFCSTIAQNGYTPMVYLDTNNITSRPQGYANEILSRYGLWYAYPYSCYNPNSKSYIHNMYQMGDTVPPRNYSYAYWQYSWWGKVSGIDGPVDMNIRILGKTTLGAPSVNLPAEAVTSEAGKAFDPLSGVTATTSQGSTVTGNISYEIKNDQGQAVSLETAQQTIGKYTITYSYTDSFRGKVTNSLTWTVTEPTASPTPADGDITDTPTPTPADGEQPPTDTPVPTPPDTQDQPEDTPVPTPADGGNNDDNGGDNGQGENPVNNNGNDA